MTLDPMTLARFLAKVNTYFTAEGCWRWMGSHNRAGGTHRVNWTGNTCRPRFRLDPSRRGAGTHVYVTRLMLALTDGVPLSQREGLYACHKTTCPHDWCINPSHLYWGTIDDNVNDRYPRRIPSR